MVKRRDLKNVHEEAVLRHFKAHLENDGRHLNILDRPEPPEAIADLDGERTWIEITDAFLDKAHAIGLTSFAADDVDHIPDDGRLVLDPDATFSSVLLAVIEAKYDKAEAVAHDEAASVAKLVTGKPANVFNTIYVYEGTGWRSFHVLYKREA
jgi:hypothetical protein